MTGRPLPATQRGTVLAGVKATPCGWPTRPALTPAAGGTSELPPEPGPTKADQDQDPSIRGLHAFWGWPRTEPYSYVLHARKRPSRSRSTARSGLDRPSAA